MTVRASAMFLVVAVLLPSGARADVAGSIRFPTDRSRVAAVVTSRCLGETTQGLYAWTLRPTPGARYTLTSTSPYDAWFSIAFLRDEGCAGSLVWDSPPYVPPDAVLAIVALHPSSNVSIDSGYTVSYDVSCGTRCLPHVDRHGDPSVEPDIRPSDAMGASFAYREEAP